MNLHGVEISDESHADYYFGLQRLIDAFAVPVQASQDSLSVSERDAIRRFSRENFVNLHIKFRDTFYKFNKAATKLGNLFDDANISVYDGQPLTEAAPHFNALADIPFYMDSLITYFRILADLIAKIIPYFFVTTDRIPTKSFRDHKKWFAGDGANFDSKSV